MCIIGTQKKYTANGDVDGKCEGQWVMYLYIIMAGHRTFTMYYRTRVSPRISDSCFNVMYGLHAEIDVLSLRGQSRPSFNTNVLSYIIILDAHYALLQTKT